ncbi:hypothetical protein QPK14_21055 [Photorhabdus temperata subsp. temperata]|uniref:Ribbon-helix-helix protein, copG family n=1 Tax=Photorhabdus temperata subsp. temperata Meg1 TaxID=1393735 RepID=A0A081RST3_PHOTE|nr:hypothetical protein [Photorhabdus temperata]KER01736.1 Ribbon-helix-helix protein, copG family [Photorhabdus temperata subsp. temperata Meg1]
MNMKQVKHVQRSRIPRGFVSKNPVPIRLSPDERRELEMLAEKEGRSLSSMARIVHLVGMVAIESELQAD